MWNRIKAIFKKIFGGTPDPETGKTFIEQVMDIGGEIGGEIVALYADDGKLSAEDRAELIGELVEASEKLGLRQLTRFTHEILDGVVQSNEDILKFVMGARIALALIKNNLPVPLWRVLELGISFGFNYATREKIASDLNAKGVQ